MFHLPKGKGCALYKLVHERQLPKRLVPSICRLYPLTWGGEELTLSDDFYPKCNCTHKNCGSRNILESQLEEVKDIFEFSDDVKKELESKPL